MSRTAVAPRPIRVCFAGSSSELPPRLQNDLDSLQPDVEVVWSPALADVVSVEPDVARGTPVPDILVVLQQQPDHVSSRQVRALLTALPLTRLIVSYGPWCDSDGRTRQVWPLACRVPQHLLWIRLRQELSVVRGNAPPLPLTADRDECWERDCAGVPVPVRRSLSVAIATPDPAIAEWLHVALSATGHRVVDLSAGSADVLLFDAEPWGPARAASLPTLPATARALPKVALVGFSRSAQQRSLLTAGVRAVVDRMAPVSELSRILEEATAAPHSDRPVLHLVTDA